MQTLIDEHPLILMEAAIVESLRRDEMVPLDPILMHARTIYDDLGRERLQQLYVGYLRIATRAGLPFWMCTPTWRTNAERVARSGVDPRINTHAVEFMRALRESQGSAAHQIKIGGLIGCKNDCYQPSEALSTAESETFHAWQIDQIADGGVDFLFATTLPNLDEAVGIARAMSATDIPYVISFVINRAGQLLDGTPLPEAIETIDNAMPRAPLGYFVNCAYPTFLNADRQPKGLFSRLIGFQGNASSRDHAELEGAEELLMDRLSDWGDEMIWLHHTFGIKILGGCCGTNAAHLQYLVDKLRDPEQWNRKSESQ